jgi:hypothetical protein
MEEIMGRTNYSALGYGYTEREAYRNALEIDREHHGHQEGYSGTIGSSTHENDKAVCQRKPVIAKRCTVDKVTNKGTRKWKTVYVLSPTVASMFDAVRVVDGTQAEAIKKAKELALEKQCTYSIDIEKRLVHSSSTIATITPQKSVTGMWLFTGTARE